MQSTDTSHMLPYMPRYHHVTVLLFTWFCYTQENPGIVFVAMNYTVHAVMYGYYYLMAVSARPKWLKPQVPTNVYRCGHGVISRMKPLCVDVSVCPCAWCTRCEAHVAQAPGTYYLTCVCVGGLGAIGGVG